MSRPVKRRTVNVFGYMKFVSTSRSVILPANPLDSSLSNAAFETSTPAASICTRLTNSING
ncbi:hypothetical protein D3C76_1433030 [compost metagenome]